MEITSDGLRQYYASLSDEMLREIDPAELTDVARGCYLREIQARGLASEPALDAAGLEIEPDWLDHAACACAFTAVPGSTYAPDAERARDALLSAGVPCQLSVVSPDPDGEGRQRFDEYRVMVPAALNLKAISVLDKEIFNDDLENDWRAHFEGLSDDEMAALKPEIICAGLLDRVERLTRVYEEEIARRRDA